MKRSLPAEFFANCMLTDELLTDDVLDDIRSVYNEFGMEAVHEQAKKKKVLPYFAHSLIKADCDTEFWTKIHNRYYERNIKIIDLLDRVFKEFDKRGLKKICVSENFASILISDACLGCFCSGDIDFYCDELDVDMLDDVMTSFGFCCGDRHPRKKSFAREYKSMDAIGEEFWLNFQWKPMTRKKSHLYDQRYILKRYHTLFDTMTVYKNTSIKLFSPEALTYLNCVHIASGHYYILDPGIRLYADIDRPARACEIDWKRVRTMAEEDHLGVRTDTVLALSELQLETPVPDKAYTKKRNTKKFSDFIDRLIDSETLQYKRPAKNKIAYILFLIKTELDSDGSNKVAAFMKRIWVILTEYN